MVDRIDRPRDEGMYVPPVEGDKKEKEKFKHIPAEDKEVMMATFFSYLKKLFDTFSPSKKLAGKVVDQQSIIEHLKKLKQLLEKLGTKDLSNNSDFALELSGTWIHLIEDFETIEIIERDTLSRVARFREMMDTIKNYPPDSEHRIGYYLLEQAGKDWLPFPFIEMLERLHKGHVENPKESTLSNWFALIDGVIDGLKSSLPFKP